MCFNSQSKSHLKGNKRKIPKSRDRKTGTNTDICDIETKKRKETLVVVRFT